MQPRCRGTPYDSTKKSGRSEFPGEFQGVGVNLELSEGLRFQVLCTDSMLETQEGEEEVEMLAGVGRRPLRKLDRSAWVKRPVPNADGSQAQTQEARRTLKTIPEH